MGGPDHSGVVQVDRHLKGSRLQMLQLFHRIWAGEAACRLLPSSFARVYIRSWRLWESPSLSGIAEFPNRSEEVPGWHGACNRFVGALSPGNRRSAQQDQSLAPTAAAQEIRCLWTAKGNRPTYGNEALCPQHLSRFASRSPDHFCRAILASRCGPL
jgi:hypothetical protein